MAEGFLADVAATSLSSLVSAVADPLIHAWGHQDDVNNLKKRVRLAQALLSDAMMSTSTVASSQAGQVWLEDFTDVVRNAESVLAEVDYQLLRRKIQKHNKVRSKLGSFIRGFRLTQKIKDMTSVLPSMKFTPEVVRLVSTHRNALLPTRVTTPPKPARRRQLWTRLRLWEGRVMCVSWFRGFSPAAAGDLPVLAIVGERIWVTVSEPFDTVTILSEMLQSRGVFHLANGVADSWTLFRQRACANGNLSVLAILGSGGVGNTTLVQCLCQHKEIIKNFGRGFG